MIGPGKKKKQKTSLNLVLLQWAGQGRVINLYGDMPVVRNLKRMPKDSTRMSKDFLKDPFAQ